MTALLRYLPFLAVLAAVVVFVSFDPQRLASLGVQWHYLFASAVALYVLFWFRALTWWRFLGSMDVDISVSRAVTSHFITVLTKYLPGKVWPVLSTAAYIESRDHAYRDSLASVGWYQLAIVVSGVGVGAAGLLFVLGAPAMYLPLPLLLVFLAALVFERPWIADRVLRPVARRLGLSPRRPRVRAPGLLAECTLQWGVLVVAYWLMYRSVTADLPLAAVLAQPLANVFGMLVPFAPAGLGIREAAGAGYIATQVADTGSALLLASLARAWSFAVEVAVFCTGMLIRARA